MLEMGMSLVAVNLPSLWFLATSVIPEKVRNGLRSFASLTSLRSDRSGSNRSGRSGTSSGDSEKEGVVMAAGPNGSISSTRPSESHHIYDGPDLESQKTHVYGGSWDGKAPNLPKNGEIKVENSVYQHDRV